MMMLKRHITCFSIRTTRISRPNLPDPDTFCCDKFVSNQPEEVVSMKLRVLSHSMAVLCFAAVSFAQVARTAPDLVPTGKGWGVAVDKSAKPSAKPRRGNGITYHGGPLMTAGPNVYYIWYGNWQNGSI